MCAQCLRNCRTTQRKILVDNLVDFSILEGNICTLVSTTIYCLK